MSNEKQWAASDASRAATAEALARIDRAQASYPRCALCGQRCVKLDRFGLCSKTSEPHQEWRARGRAERKAGVR